jgi:Protein of unknown function (DUF3540)
MDNLARKLDLREAVQEVGSVARVDGGALWVKGEGFEYKARRASSCLLAPEPGDLVLVASLPSGACFVVAILERTGATPPTLTAEGDLTVRLPQGKFVVAAQDGIELVASKAVQIVAGAFQVNAVDGSLVFERLSVLSTFVRAEVERVKTFAGTIDSVVDRVTERVKRVYRTVEEFEQVRAERIDYQAEKTLNLRAENALLTAEQLVKIDGEQIHLG